MTSHSQDLECTVNNSLRLSEIDQIMTPKSKSQKSYDDKIFNFDGIEQIQVHGVSKSNVSSEICSESEFFYFDIL
jgi:hypothetical protein